jgi:hypothetical protein
VPHPPALGNRARNCSCNNQRPGLGVDPFFFRGKLRFLIAKNRLLVAILVDIFRVFLCWWFLTSVVIVDDWKWFQWLAFFPMVNSLSCWWFIMANTVEGRNAAPVCNY